MDVTEESTSKVKASWADDESSDEEDNVEVIGIVFIAMEYVYICIDRRVYMCMYVCIYIYIYIYIQETYCFLATGR